MYMSAETSASAHTDTRHVLDGCASAGTHRSSAGVLKTQEVSLFKVSLYTLNVHKVSIVFICLIYMNNMYNEQTL